MTSLGYAEITERSPGAPVGAAHIERLKPADVMLIWPEGVGWPQEIGAIAILEGEGLLDDGRLRLDAVTAHVEAKLAAVPRFRQVIAWPRRRLGWPIWVDAPRFDVHDHVEVASIAAPTDPALLEKCEQLRRRPLDPSKPLWKMWFLTGLPEGRVGWFVKLHHAVADGVAGVALLAAFVDLSPTPLARSKEQWAPAPWPSGRALREENIQSKRQARKEALSRVAHPEAAVTRLKRRWPAVREMFATGRAPRTSVNDCPIGSDRTLAVVRARLDEVKRTAHGFNATVNDVLLAAVGGGYRALLKKRGDEVAKLDLRTFVPVSLHAADNQAEGNVDAGMIVPIGVGIDDDVERLQLVARETAERKQLARPAAGSLFRYQLLQRAFLRLMPSQRFMNAYVANVPGPPVPVWLGEARVVDLFAVVPITANVSIGIGAISYANEFNTTVVADRDLCPDLDAFTDGLTASLEALVAAPAQPV